jgi:hypothetical protein
VVEPSVETSVERHGAPANHAEDGLVAGYFVVQAAVGVGLWALVAAVPTIRSWFELVPERRTVVDAFVVPDVLVIVTGSLATAWAIWQRRSWAPLASAFTAGALVYPTVYLLAWVGFTSGSGAAALAVMIPPTALTCWTTARLWSTRS